MQSPQLMKTRSSPQSLLSGPVIKKQSKIKVFFQQLSKTHKIQIDAENMTTQAVIAAAIQVLNQTYNLCLMIDPD